MAGNLRKALFFFCLLTAATLPFDFLLRETGLNTPFIKSYQEILILVTLFLWELLIVCERRIPFRRTAIDYPLAAFFLIHLFSSLYPSINVVWSLKYTFRLFGFAVIFYAVLNFVDSDRRLELLLWALFLGAAAASLMAIAQRFFRQAPAVTLIAMLQDFLEDIPSGPERRIRGPFLSPAVLACYMASVIPLGVSFLMCGMMPLIKKALLLFITALMAAALFLSGVTAGFVALTAGLAVLFIIRSLRRKNAHMFIGAFAIILLLCVLTLFTVVDFDKIRDCVFQNIPQLQTVSELGLWKAGLDMIISRPVKGWGADMFFWRYPSVTASGLPYGFMPQHRSYNIFLEAGSTTGIFGIAVFIWFIYAVFRTLAQRPPSADKSPLRRSVWAGAISSLIVFFTHSQFDIFLISHETLGLFWILIGIGACNVFMPERRQET